MNNDALRRITICSLLLIVEVHYGNDEAPSRSTYIKYSLGAAAIAALSYLAFTQPSKQKPADTLCEIGNNAMHPQQRTILESMRDYEYLNETGTISTCLARYHNQPTHRIISYIHYNGNTEILTKTIPLFENNETDARYRKKIECALWAAHNHACISTLKKD